jgi:hypothetical protein
MPPPLTCAHLPWCRPRPWPCLSALTHGALGPWVPLSWWPSSGHSCLVWTRRTSGGWQGACDWVVAISDGCDLCCLHSFQLQPDSSHMT